MVNSQKSFKDINKKIKKGKHNLRATLEATGYKKS